MFVSCVMCVIFAVQLASAETQTYELKETHSAEVKRLEEELDRAERRKSDDVNLAVEELETVSAVCNLILVV